MKNGDSRKGQLHTLEGLAGSVVLVLAITYAFSAFVVTPTSDVKPGTGTNQKVAQDLLEASSENGDLKNLTTHWNGSTGFINSTGGVYYYEGKEPDPANLSIGNSTENVFTERGLSYNIDISFLKDSGTGTLTVVDNGNPGSSAVSATQTVVLDDNDTVEIDGDVRRINNTSGYPIPKQGERIYNRAEVTVTVW